MKEHSLSEVPVSWRLILTTTAVPVVLVLLAALALLPSTPNLLHTQDVDSGVFLYIGSQILDGGVPYRDIWDHKPPLIFFLNALALALGGPKRWGIWALDLLSISAACWMLYAFLRRYFGQVAAVFAAVSFLGNLYFVFEYGNLPESYGLPLQAAALLLLVKSLEKQDSRIYPLVMGILIGLSASLKQTLVGIGLVTALCLFVSNLGPRGWRAVIQLLWIGLGFVLVWLGWAAYFASHNALADFWDQAIRFNLYYSGGTTPERVSALADVLKNLYANSGFFALGLLTWLVVLPFLFFNDYRFRVVLTSRWTGAAFLLSGSLLILNSLINDYTGTFLSLAALSPYRWMLLTIGIGLCAVSLAFFSGWVGRVGSLITVRSEPGDCSPLMLPLGIALLDLPLELLLSSLSGRNYFHYFIPVLPTVTILIAFLVWAVYSGYRPAAERVHANIWLAILALPVIITGWKVTFDAVAVYENQNVRMATAYVRSNSQPHDAILQWGSSGHLYFQSDRLAASRFLYQQALFTPGYTSPEKIGEFLADLSSKPPLLIVDTRPEKMPLLTAALTDCTRFVEDEFMQQVLRSQRDERFPLEKEVPLPWVSPEMKSVYQWVCENYEPIWPDNMELDDWHIYRLRGERP